MQMVRMPKESGDVEVDSQAFGGKQKRRSG